ncbi:MAG: ABC transporter permease subunit [Oscillospiraceae bacterium]|jgi:sodium transport system permease protein|nr:ABC transporter permease subunit [Oscillospiraceae bacterium]
MFEQTIVVFLKEMKNILRDKKTFIVGLLIPFFLVPTMLWITSFSMKNTQSQISQSVVVAFDNSDNFFYDFCSSQKNIKIIEAAPSELESGKISAYILTSKDINKKILSGNNFEINVKYSESSINSIMTSPVLLACESAFREMCAEVALYSKNSNLKTDEIRKYLTSYQIPIKEPDSRIVDNMGSMYFNILTPMMLILYCCVGSVGCALDMTAGEKERGTLEPLLSTGAVRSMIILGKLSAAALMGIFSSICTGIGLCVYLYSSSGKISIGIRCISILFLTVIFTSVFFAAINLIIGTYAKSYKEAQTYTVPISIVCLIPSYFTYFLNSSDMSLFYFLIPVLNIVCLMKELLAGIINPLHIMTSFLGVFLYIAISVFVILHMFKQEKIIFKI